jgi:hypothetical protein
MTLRCVRNRGAGLAVGILLVASCASRLPAAAPGDRLLERFHDRIDEYMDLRSRAVEAVGGVESTADPASIIADRETLGAEIRRRRSDAKHGDILTPEVRSYVRQLLVPVLKGERSDDVRFRLNDDAPDAGAVRLEVNARYPAGLSFPTTPWPILLRLPRLPAGLSYRIIGRDMILLDEPADLIVDYMRNALPRQPAA